MTSEELSVRLKEESNRKMLRRKGNHTTPIELNFCRGNANVNNLQRKVKATSGSYYGTNEERELYQQKARSMAARHNGGAAFLTFTPDDYKSIVVSFFAGETIKNPNKIVENDIPLLEMRIEVAGRNAFPCRLFFQKCSNCL